MRGRIRRSRGIGRGTSGWGDVRDRKPVPGHIRLLRQHAVHPARRVAHLFSLGRAEVGELRLLQRRQARMRVADAVGGFQEQLQLGAAVRHLDEGALLEAFAHQVVLRVQPFQVGADGARLGQLAAVVEFEHRDLRHRVLAGEGLAAVLSLEQVDLHRLDAGDALFCDEHEHAARVRGAGAGVQLHGSPPGDCGYGQHRR
jgi:hypothetical protein